MYNGYKKILLGLIISTFSINLGGIKILPPFIGFIFILTGISHLYKETHIKLFNNAKIIAIVISTITFIGELISFLSVELNNYFVFNKIIIVFCKVIELIMFYKIFDGSIQYLNDNNHSDLAHENVKELRAYIIGTLINIILLNFAVLFHIQYLNIIVIIMVIVLRIYLILLIHNLKSVFNPQV